MFHYSISRLTTSTHVAVRAPSPSDFMAAAKYVVLRCSQAMRSQGSGPSCDRFDVPLCLSGMARGLMVSDSSSLFPYVSLFNVDLHACRARSTVFTHETQAWQRVGQGGFCRACRCLSVFIMTPPVLHVTSHFECFRFCVDVTSDCRLNLAVISTRAPTWCPSTSTPICSRRTATFERKALDTSSPCSLQ